MNNSQFKIKFFSTGGKDFYRESAKAAKKIFNFLFFFKQGQSCAFLGVLRALAFPRSWYRLVRIGLREKSSLALILLSFLLLGMDGSERENDELRRLGEKQAQLTTRIEALKEEQDFLLFQRSIAGSDSKYLLLDISAGAGTLNYRNRILRTFGFSLSASKPHQLRRGQYIITGKTDGSPGKRALVFRDAFVIHGKGYLGSTSDEKKLPGIVIGRRDLAAIFYAVDSGTMLYIR